MNHAFRPAPIALFAYSRPDHLARTLASLAANPEAAESELYVFADAAREGDARRSGVEAVRAMLPGITGFAAVHLVLREHNLGLARNITSGVSHVLERAPHVIVLEDDMVVSPHLLRYMNDGLVRYAGQPRVGSLSGYSYPTSAALPETFFIRGADCWGWATWRDRWALFEPDGQKLLAQLEARGLSHAFDFEGAANYCAMLRDQIAGRNDSWAVRWHAGCFLADRLILYPARSLVWNIGADGTGSHFTTSTDMFDSGLSRTPVAVDAIAIEESAAGRAAIRQFYLETHAPASLAETPAPAPSAGAGDMQPTARWRQLARRWMPPAAAKIYRNMRGITLPPPPSGAGPAAVQQAVEQEPPGVPAASLYRGLEELDRKIKPYLDFDNGYFVELGANDGLFQSNTWHYETCHGWRGVLVEPAPNLFLECRRNRSPLTHVACAACVSFDYEPEFVRIIYANAMSASVGLESDLPDAQAHAEIGRQFLAPHETVFAYGALARPLSAILDEAGAPATIDFLSLDVEGAEIEVLKGVDHSRYRFRRMLIECRDIDKLTAYLEPLGYRLAERFNHHDYMFIRPDDPEA
jgi:FkbM family methyltransferase